MKNHYLGKYEWAINNIPINIKNNYWKNKCFKWKQTWREEIYKIVKKYK
jgi:hypothetical protein